MAKRKSNSSVKRLLAWQKCPDSFRISNRRWLVFGSNYPFVWEFVKPSRRQRRAAKIIQALRAEAQEKTL